MNEHLKNIALYDIMPGMITRTNVYDINIFSVIQSSMHNI